MLWQLKRPEEAISLLRDAVEPVAEARGEEDSEARALAETYARLLTAKRETAAAAEVTARFSLCPRCFVKLPLAAGAAHGKMLDGQPCDAAQS